MAFVVTASKAVTPISAPSLPLAPDEWNRQYQDQLSNVLRLYFNQVDNTIRLLSTSSGVIPATTIYKVADLPSAATSGVGSRAFVSDATATTFASTVAGGGANNVPVYSDGTNWKIG
jgi:hypothetical protein